MFSKLLESLCNTIHHLLEYMGSGHGSSMKKNSLKALPIYSSKRCIVLHTKSYIYVCVFTDTIYNLWKCPLFNKIWSMTNHGLKYVVFPLIFTQILNNAHFTMDCFAKLINLVIYKHHIVHRTKIVGDIKIKTIF